MYYGITLLSAKRRALCTQKGGTEQILKSLQNGSGCLCGLHNIHVSCTEMICIVPKKTLFTYEREETATIHETIGHIVPII